MDQLTIERYLKDDYAKALKFYDDRSKISKTTFRILSIYLIVASAFLTTLISLAPDEIGWRVFTALISSTIIIATGLLAHLKSQENWISYRSSWDALERERRLFDTGICEYCTCPDKNALFVQKIEAILAKEGIDFYSRHSKKTAEDTKTKISG